MHACIGPLFLPPNGSLKMLDWGLSWIFDVKTRGDVQTLQTSSDHPAMRVFGAGSEVLVVEEGACACLQLAPLSPPQWFIEDVGLGPVFDI